MKIYYIFILTFSLNYRNFINSSFVERKLYRDCDIIFTNYKYQFDNVIILKSVS